MMVNMGSLLCSISKPHYNSGNVETSGNKKNAWEKRVEETKQHATRLLEDTVVWNLLCPKTPDVKVLTVNMWWCWIVESGTFRSLAQGR